MTEWTESERAPSHGPLFQAAMGATPAVVRGRNGRSVTGTTDSVRGGARVESGRGSRSPASMRFVAAVLNSTTVFVNAPFTNG